MFENLNSSITKKISFEDIPKWSEDDHLAAFKALLKGEKKDYSSQNIKTMAQAKVFFEQNYNPYKIKNAENDNSLYTGYFEPKLKASRIKTDMFRYPLYGVPVNKDQCKQYFNLTRESLTKNKYKKLPTLAWLDDKIDLYFMHIQGSGLLEFADGTHKRFVYAGKNNFQYNSIGKYLTDNGIISKTDISMLKIKDWLKDTGICSHRQRIVKAISEKAYVIELMTPDPSVANRGKQKAASPDIKVITKFP